MRTRSRFDAPSFNSERPAALSGPRPPDGVDGIPVAPRSVVAHGFLERAARFAPLLVFVLWVVALLVLSRELSAYHYHELRRELANIPAGRLALALSLTALSYCVLFPLYDALALRYVARPTPLLRSWLSSFIAFALSQNVGLSALSGGSVRYRFWSSWGIPGADIARGVAFGIASVWLGAIVVLSVTLTAGATTLAPLPATLSHGVGIAAALLVLAYLAWSASRLPLRLRGLRLRAPALQLSLPQLLVSVADWSAAAAALYVLVPGPVRPGLLAFIAAFVVAQVIGIISHVPGGLGIFESGMLVLLRPATGAAVLVPALVAFRVIYYVVPLTLALTTFAVHEFAERRAPLTRAWQIATGWAALAAPTVLSVATFAAGAILLVSGATPALHGRLRILDDLFPLGVIEISHFAGSIAGMMLVLLAIGVHRRLDAAYHATLLVLGVGIVASLLKGLDYEEAAFLALVLATLLPARAQFYRRAALLAQRPSPAWIAAIAAVVVGTVWLAAFSYKHVDYSSDLWWQFALRADAPRALRAMVGAMTVLAAFGTLHLLSPSRARPPVSSPDDVARARSVAGRTTSAQAHLALVGDKALLFDASGESFLMYGVRGRSWIALGDPIGEDAARRELVWRFHELADRHGGRTVFYAVSAQWLPLYVDLGLMLFKIGEEARVPLRDFSIEAPDCKWMRRVLRLAEREALSFEIVEPERVPGLLPRLRRVSDAWLAEKATREKGFTLGRFDDSYLSSFPVAIVTRGDDVLAFANVWASTAREELSIDLMRHVPGAPRGVMDLVFIHLIQWGASQGYRWFSLGMAPLSGIEARSLAPLWNRMSALVFRHGEHFYNFQGIRQYKEKFHPVWEPRYLATQGGLALPRVLLDVTSLVAGGLSGVVRK